MITKLKIIYKIKNKYGLLKVLKYHHFVCICNVDILNMFLQTLHFLIQMHRVAVVFGVSHLPLRPPLGSRRGKICFCFFVKQSRRPTHFHPAQQTKNQ